MLSLVEHENSFITSEPLGFSFCGVCLIVLYSFATILLRKKVLVALPCADTEGGGA